MRRQTEGGVLRGSRRGVSKTSPAPLQAGDRGAAGAEAPRVARPAEIEQALAREAALIEEKLPKGGAVIALCIEGTELSSEALSKKLAQLASAGASQLTFLIGGSFGLHPRVKQRADLRLSMSPMTFPHHLARVMLLEQLYRAYQIDAGTRYHK